MGRSPCCEKGHTNKGAWTKEEDQKLTDYIKSHGEGCWRIVPQAAGLLRCGKSCRLRWINYLRPDLKRGNFSEAEDELIIKLHALLGNKWSLIAGRLAGRTDNEIKNRWNSHIRRKLLSRGIDPQTHRPTSAAATHGATARSSTDDGRKGRGTSGGGGGEKNIMNNLDLTMSSLPLEYSSSSAQSPPPRDPKPSIMSTSQSISTGFVGALCLCCHLGFQSCETCSMATD